MITLKDEWVIEQIGRQNGRNVMRCIGKVIFNEPKESLSEAELEAIWDLCNFGQSQRESKTFDCWREPFASMPEVYNGMRCYKADEADCLLIPMSGARGYCNDDIFIRRHYDTDEGYAIFNAHRTESDQWRKVSSIEFRNYHIGNKFLSIFD